MQSFKSFGDVNRTLSGFVTPTWPSGKQYTLERMYKLMKFLGDPQNQLQIIHIAGTSGKTSTVYYVSAQLIQAGKKVGTTVSPHVDQVNERVQINLKPLPEKQFCKDLSVFLDLVKKSKIQPSYFELLVAFAYWEFARQNVDYAVIEVGLGGLLDGTNVVSREDKVCVITDIGLDHTSVLGDNLASIAKQKAGIITPHNAVFCLNQSREVVGVIKDKCADNHAQLFEIDLEMIEPSSTMPLFQQRNWRLAREVYDYIRQRDDLPLLSKRHQLTAQHVHIPARMEQVELPKGKVLILDGAHNPQKLHALSESVKQLYPSTDKAILFGLISGKDTLQADSIAEIASLASHFIFTGFKAEQDMPRPSADPYELNKKAKKQGFAKTEVVEKPDQAFKALLMRPEKILIVAGSFYLLNHIRPLVFDR